MNKMLKRLVKIVAFLFCFNLAAQQGNFKVIEKDKKFGVESGGKMVVPCEYDSVGILPDEKELRTWILTKDEEKNFPATGFPRGFMVKKNGKTGLLKADGQQWISIDYNYIAFDYDKENKCYILTGAKKDLLYNFGVDGKLTGKGKKFYTDLTPCKEGDLWAHCNLVDVAYFPMYEFVAAFEGDFAPVKKNGKFGVINRKNETVIPFEYETIYHCEFAENSPHQKKKMFAAQKNGKWALLDTKGSALFAFEYDEVGSFDEYGGTAEKRSYIRGFTEWVMVKSNNKYGATDLKGKVMIPCKWDYLRPDEDTKGWRAMKGDEHFFINEKGEAKKE